MKEGLMHLTAYQVCLDQDHFFRVGPSAYTAIQGTQADTSQ